MLKALINVRLTALRVWFTGGGQSKKPRSRATVIGFSMLMLYSLAALGFMFWHIFDTMAAPFHALGLDWLFFSMAAISAFAVMFIGSVFFAKAQLYEARDNDLLLSMPVTPADILLSRMAMLLVISFFFELPTLAAAFAVGLRYGLMRGLGIAAFIIVFLLLPFFSTAISALFGWLLSVVTARIKHKSIVATVLCTALIAAYSVFMARLNSAIIDFAASAGRISSVLSPIAPVYWAGNAIGGANLKHLVYSAGLFIAVFAAVCLLLKATFMRTAAVNRGAAREQYKEKQSRLKSLDSALLDKEFARLLSSSAYMVNSGLGLLMMLIASAALLIKQAAVKEIAFQPMIAPFIVPALLLALCLLSSMNFISAPSVSLEGRNIWIAKSFPVDERQILNAKLKMHLYVSLPPLIILQTVCIVLFRPDLVSAVLIILLPIGFTFFSGVLGLVENLHHPSLDWINETQAVKSGVGLLFTMLINWGILLLPVLIFILSEGRVDFKLLAILLLTVICAGGILLYIRLLREGVRRFREL